MKRIHVIGCILPLSNPSLPREQCVKRATVQKKISDITFMSSTLYGFLKVSAEHLSHTGISTAFRCGETERKYLLPCSLSDCQLGA